jgi:hypothetical protein
MDRREFIKGALLTGVVVSGIGIVGNQLQGTSLHKKSWNPLKIEDWLLNTGLHHLDDDVVETLTATQPFYRPT